MNFKKLALAAGLSFAMSASVTNAATLWSFEDDDIDFILDPTTLLPKSSGPMTAGDIFVSVFEIDPYAINGVPSIPNGKELTGVAAVQLLNTPDPTPGSGLFFAPYTGGLDAILGLATTPTSLAGPLGDAGTGATIAMWLNSDTTGAAGVDRDLDLNRTTNPATNCTSLADCIAEASMGSLFQVDGFAGDPDEYWTAVSLFPGATDIGSVAGINNGTLIAGFNFGLSTLYNSKGVIGFQDVNGDLCDAPGYIADGCLQLVGSGTLTGGSGLSNGAIAHSDFDATKWDIPEPSIAFLLGAGLLGMGASLRKRKA